MSRSVVRFLVCPKMSLVGIDRSRLVWIGWFVTGYVVICLVYTEMTLVGVDRSWLV